MKLRNSLILFLIILFTVLQCTLLNYVRIFESKPDILLILIIFFSLHHGQIYGLAVGALCALFSEATCGLPTGTAVFTYSLGALLLGHIARWVHPAFSTYEEKLLGRKGGVSTRRVLGQMSVTFIFCCVIYLFLFLLFQTFGANPITNGAGLSLVNALSSIILPVSFYTACISPIVFWFLKTIYPPSPL